MEAWMALPFVKENDVSRHRLESLVTKLSEADLARTTDYGWTVSALLAHLAFWDRRVLALARRWKAKGIDESPIDSDAMNDAVKPLCHSIPPRAAIELCLSSAREADAELESLSADLVRKIEESPNHFRFNRGLHRADHLKDIEQVLARA
jgi:hypothetical protein